MTRRCPVSRRRRHPADTRQWRSSWPSVWPSYSLSSSSSSLSLSFDVSTASDWRTPSTRRHLAAVQHASEDHFCPGVSNRSAPSSPSQATLPPMTRSFNAVANIVGKFYGDESDRTTHCRVPNFSTDFFELFIIFTYYLRQSLPHIAVTNETAAR